MDDIVMWAVGKNGCLPLAHFVDEAKGSEYIGTVLMQTDPVGVTRGDYYLDEHLGSGAYWSALERLTDLVVSDAYWGALERLTDLVVSDLTEHHLECVWSNYRNLAPYTEAEPFWYCDDDYKLHRIEWPHDDQKAYVHCGYGRNMLYVLHGRIHDSELGDTRQFFMYDFYDDIDGLNYKPLPELVSNGGTKYNDIRDLEYSGSSRGWHGMPVSGSLGVYHRIKNGLFNVEMANDAFLEMVLES